jgi:hypothetical protein
MWGPVKIYVTAVERPGERKEMVKRRRGDELTLAQRLMVL